jgi:hypothetical protein
LGTANIILKGAFITNINDYVFRYRNGMIMNKELNVFERAILNWYKDHYKDSRLSAQIDTSSLSERKYTGVGFFVYLDIEKTQEKVDINIFGGHWPINGPNIISSGITSGGEAILWGEDGYIDCIEIFSYYGKCDENIIDYELK